MTERAEAYNLIILPLLTAIPVVLHLILNILVSEAMDPDVRTQAEDRRGLESLPLLDHSKQHQFLVPSKKINETQDVQRFLVSRAYADIGRFIMQLNISMCPRRYVIDGKTITKKWELGDLEVFFSEAIKRIQNLLEKIDAITDEIPPDPGPRRFGNIGFRKWHELLESKILGFLEETLPANIVQASITETAAKDELIAYLLGGFGSAQRLDYGTGHEL